MSAYRVTAPYVTLKVRDVNGAEVVQGFYEGALVEDAVAGDSLDKHVRTGMVEKESASRSTSDKEPVKKTASSTDKS